MEVTFDMINKEKDKDRLVIWQNQHERQEEETYHLEDNIGELEEDEYIEDNE